MVDAIEHFWSKSGARFGLCPTIVDSFGHECHVRRVKIFDICAQQTCQYDTERNRSHESGIVEASRVKEPVHAGFGDVNEPRPSILRADGGYENFRLASKIVMDAWVITDERAGDTERFH
jgi:hypothetical protein